jgi:hypothetical protein
VLLKFSTLFAFYVNGDSVIQHFIGYLYVLISSNTQEYSLLLNSTAKLGLFEEEELQMEQEQRMLRLDHNRSKTRQESPSEKHDRPVLPPWETEREKNVESDRRNAAPQGNSRDEKIPTWEQNRTYDIKTHAPSPSRKEYDRYVGNVPKDEVDVSHSSRSKEEYDTNMESTPQIPVCIAIQLCIKPQVVVVVNLFYKYYTHITMYCQTTNNTNIKQKVSYTIWLCQK